MKLLFYFWGVTLLVIAAAANCGAADDAVPLPSAHAHNDYHHPRPLLDALAHGFSSVEADVSWSKASF